MEELYKKAIILIETENKASTSFFQRKLLIDYSTAKNLIDLLEERGVIGKENGAKPREIIK